MRPQRLQPGGQLNLGEHDADGIAGTNVAKRDGGAREDARAGGADGDALAEPLRRLALERDAHAIAAQEPVRGGGERHRQDEQDADDREEDPTEHE